MEHQDIYSKNLHCTSLIILVSSTLKVKVGWVGFGYSVAVANSCAWLPVVGGAIQFKAFLYALVVKLNLMSWGVQLRYQSPESGQPSICGFVWRCPIHKWWLSILWCRCLGSMHLKKKIEWSFYIASRCYCIYWNQPSSDYMLQEKTFCCLVNKGSSCS